ncbi:MAG: class I SAM-dependent methyltransferase [Acidobacteriota bacterium]|nr:class I SAM-dependent methyltransferase [Acidobacteriota bacterium]
MDAEQIKRRRAETIEKYGAWTAHNIHLGHGLYTYDPGHPEFGDRIAGYTRMLRRVLQIASDLTGRPLHSLRVLDLGCMEGVYGIEFALHGAEVVGVEIREASIEKARFAKEALSLENITFVQDDVRNLSAEVYGTFDVVLCIGILYHLDAPDVFGFVERMSEVCRGVTIIDTHVGLNPNRTFTYRGREYHGWTFQEHQTNATQEEKQKTLLASIDNQQSFWFSRASLFNLLGDVGFPSVYDCQNPAFPGQLADRDTLVAVKGERQEVLSFSEKGASIPPARWPEVLRLAPEVNQQSHDGTAESWAIRNLKRVYRRARRQLLRR